MLTRIVALTGIVLGSVLMALQLYTSHEVSTAEREIRQLRAEMGVERRRIHHLEGAWSYVTAPAMLRPVVEEYTDMVPMTGRHLATLDDIPYASLPPVPSMPAAVLAVSADGLQPVQVTDALLAGDR